MQNKLYSQVWTQTHHDSEMGEVPPINWGQVVKQTPKSIWIRDQFTTEKWTVQADGSYKQQLHNIKRKFNFELDPLVKFVLAKT